MPVIIARTLFALVLIAGIPDILKANEEVMISEDFENVADGKLPAGWNLYKAKTDSDSWAGVTSLKTSPFPFAGKTGNKSLVFHGSTCHRIYPAIRIGYPKVRRKDFFMSVDFCIEDGAGNLNFSPGYCMKSGMGSGPLLSIGNQTAPNRCKLAWVEMKNKRRKQHYLTEIETGVWFRMEVSCTSAKPEYSVKITRYGGKTQTFPGLKFFNPKVETFDFAILQSLSRTPVTVIIDNLTIMQLPNEDKK